jgi:hypothetical protein
MTQSLRRLAEQSSRSGEPARGGDGDQPSYYDFLSEEPPVAQCILRLSEFRPPIEDLLDSTECRITCASTVLEETDGLTPIVTTILPLRQNDLDVLSVLPEPYEDGQGSSAADLSSSDISPAVDAVKDLTSDPANSLDDTEYSLPFVQPAAAELRNNILRDIGKPTSNDPGSVIVLVSIQADEDAMAVFATLSAALVGTIPGEVVAIDATVGTLGCDGASSKRGHGFTSLIDGTRELDDVLQESDTAGLLHVTAGLDKGTVLAADPAAVEKLLQACRGGFPVTLLNGGQWQNPFLPHILSRADGVYLLVRANVTEQEIAAQALKHFDRLGAHVRGCILVGADS